MNARDLMTTDPITVMPTDTVARAAEVMRDLDIGCIPVAEDPAIPVLLGVITDRDIAVRCVARKHDATCLVRDHMSSPPLQTVHPDADSADVVRKMEAAQIRRIPVVDESGVLLGIVAQADVATKLGPHEPYILDELLEEISKPRVEVTA